MIILDTNVISETMRPAPEPTVVAWLNRQDSLSLFLTTPTIAEVHYGIEALPNGKRRRALSDGFDRMLREAFEGRILTFDLGAAKRYGLVMSARRARGRPLSVVDGQIAAMALDRHAVIATRNVRDFEGCGVEVVDPFARGK